VILIAALLMSFMVPNMSALQTRALREHAKRIVTVIDAGRQRAVLTRSPHRVVVDLDNATYALEWMVPIDEEESQMGLEGSGFGFGAPLSLAPPRSVEREFAPAPGQLGRLASLADGIGFVDIETPSGWVDSGEVYIDFEHDGTSSFTVITLEDPEGQKLSLEILPLADTVRILNEEV
jgi:hypothetical protein